MSTFNKTFFLLITCLIIYSKTLASNYQFQTLTSDFKDITHFENQVIVYGNDNLIKYSRDFGETWENKYLDGVSKINYIRISKNNIDYVVNDSFYLHSDNINIKPKLEKLNRKGVIWSASASNEYFAVAYDNVVDIYKKSDFSVRTIQFTTSNTSIPILINGNSLFLSSGQEKLKEYDLNSIALIKEYADSCKNCREIFNIRFVNNKIIANRQSKAHGNFTHYFSIDTSNKEQIDLGTFIRGYVFDVKPKILGPELHITAD